MSEPAIEILSAQDALGIGVGEDLLVVDDDPANLVAYEAALAPLGRRVVVAGSGLDALARLGEQDFALMLCDVSMPGMNGVEMARRLRNTGMPIIFITGMTQTTEALLDAYGVGAVDVIMKPAPPELLRAKVSVYLRLQDRTQALLRQSARLREAEIQRIGAALATRRLATLQEATAALADATSAEDVATIAVRLGAQAIDAAAGTMWRVRDDGALVLLASHGVPPNYLAQFSFIAADQPIAARRVLEHRTALWVETQADYARESPETYPHARDAGRVVGFAALPLVSAGTVAAILVYSYDGEHAFPAAERDFLMAMVRSCEQALDRARLRAAEVAARERAEQLGHRKDEFLAMLGHELRNPLAAMVSALDLLKMRDAPLGRELAILDRQVAHLTHIVGDLVEVSRITQGKISLRREPVAAIDALASALDAARPLVTQYGHQLTIDIAEALVLDADRHRLVQVLANLLTNAAKYTPPGGHIAIRAIAEGSVARLEVKDNGRGISPALLPSLFELFVQGERTPDRTEGGLGIGLTLVRTVVELHGGLVRAHSDGPGTGATFTVHWPLTPVSTASSTLARVQPSAEPLRILIVDDNLDAADLLGALLESLGHQVRIAHDGGGALELVDELAPDVALLDIGLPLMDGYELARRLRRTVGGKDTFLIALTGYGEPEDRERSRSAGFAHHLVKPLDVGKLAALLEGRPHARRV